VWCHSFENDVVQAHMNGAMVYSSSFPTGTVTREFTAATIPDHEAGFSVAGSSKSS